MYAYFTWEMELWWEKWDKKVEIPCAITNFMTLRSVLMVW